MKNLHKMIILLVIIIFLILIALVVLLNIDKKKEQNTGIPDAEDFEISDKEANFENNNIYDINKIKTVENCIQKYYDAINLESSMYYGRDEKIVTDEEIYMNILDLLSENYKQENNITTKNISKYVNLLDQDVIIQVLQIKVVLGETSEKYAVYGITMDLNYKKLNEIYMYVTLDLSNKTFSIEPINEKYDSFDDIKISNQNVVIEPNDNNTYKNEALGYEEISKYYLDKYKKLALSSPEICFEYLDNEYKNLRFENYESFEKYIELNKNKIEASRLTGYNVNNYNGNSEYFCIDQNGRYYIFRETSVMDYSIILDTYTLDLPEFLEVYNTAKEPEKVGLNIQKVFSAINDGDYKYVYNKLDDTFKANNFKTIENFENYIKERLYADNKVNYTGYEQNGNAYIYTLEITDNTGLNSNVVKMQVVMALGENTDYVMSFSIN